ncbi:photosynthetic NDH subunit of lumenal location 5, chloroplastic-like [Iris pallida]|uniref:Photosynthetic NDH subunit of lumenal location 5, chloroplastic-like n=1 Tax=Iris pallida TaxID=29817 RepID=A0AAX6ERQ6_IRIPA|nr:photosynthetic NDH subunit of lumenal location 5, chloroplastic-like [Iris pallida]
MAASFTTLANVRPTIAVPRSDGRSALRAPPARLQDFRKCPSSAKKISSLSSIAAAAPSFFSLTRSSSLYRVRTRFASTTRSEAEASSLPPPPPPLQRLNLLYSLRSHKKSILI